MTPRYTANDVANWFISQVDPESGDVMTHLKLQKLVYYAQAWSLALYNTPLFKEELQAWMHGPVAPSLFRRYREQGTTPITTPSGRVKTFDNKSEHVLREVWRVYGPYSAKFLEDLTHKEEPWKQTRGNLPLEAACSRPIPKKLMREYYKSLVAS